MTMQLSKDPSIQLTYMRCRNVELSEHRMKQTVESRASCKHKKKQHEIECCIEVQRMNMFQKKIRHAPNVGKVLISRDKKKLLAFVCLVDDAHPWAEHMHFDMWFSNQFSFVGKWAVLPAIDPR